MTAPQELVSGLWHWQAPHPEWNADQHWPQLVSSCAIDDGTRLLLFDPLAVPEQLLALAARREPVIVLTAPWHERDTRPLVDALVAPVYTPSPDTAQDIVRKYGVSLPDAGDGSPDLRRPCTQRPRFTARTSCFAARRRSLPPATPGRPARRLS